MDVPGTLLRRSSRYHKHDELQRVNVGVARLIVRVREADHDCGGVA
jgi:hypothetical protein